MAHLPVGARVQQLHLVGFTTDHKQLIFSTRKGTKSGGFTVALDESLIGLIDDALRRDDTDEGNRLEQHRRFARQESQLSPREIQSRLRSGSTLSQVARDAGVDEEWVARFAAPILAEQAQVVDRAREMRYATPRKGLSGQPLGTAVRWNVAERGVRLGDDEFNRSWGAFQLVDGTWVIRFAFVSRQRPQVAEWEVDFQDSMVTARNRLASNLGYIAPRTRAPSAESLSSDAPPPPPLKPDEPPTESPARAKKRPAKRKQAKKTASKKSAQKKPVPARKASSRPVKRSSAKKRAIKVAAKRKAVPRKAVPRKAAGRKAAGRKAAAKKRPVTKKAAKKQRAQRKARGLPGAAVASTAAPVWNRHEPRSLRRAQRRESFGLPRREPAAVSQLGFPGAAAPPDAPDTPDALVHAAPVEPARPVPPADARAGLPADEPNRVVTIRADRATPPTESQLGSSLRRRRSKPGR